MSKDYMMTAEELRVRGVKRRRWIVSSIVVVVVLLVGALVARPVRDGIKGWQARRHAHNALKLIEQEKWTEARDEAVAGYQLRPTEPEALRAIGRLLSRTQQHEALDFWKQLDDRHLMTRDDRREEAAIALFSNDVTTADFAVNDLLTRKDSPVGPADWLLAAQVAMQKNAGDQARGFAKKILDDPTADERAQLRATLIILSIPPRPGSDNSAAALTDTAWARLRKIAGGTSKTALDAVVILAQRLLTLPASVSPDPQSPSPNPISDLRTPISELPDLVHELESHPLATASHKLLALDLQIHADPSQRAAMIDRAIEQWKNSDAASLAVLATWLNGKGEYQRQLDTIPLEKALQSKDLFLRHVDALGTLGRWEDIRQLLEENRYPLDRSIEYMYLARCYAQLDQKTASDNNWQRALEAAAGDPFKLMSLADYAEKNGAADIAEAAYNNAATFAPKFRPAQQGRLRLAQARRDTKKMHAILAEMLAIWPRDPSVQNDEAYTRLLLMPQDQRSEVRGQKPEVGDQKSEFGDQRSEKGDQKSEKAAENRPNDKELSEINQLAEQLVKQNPISLPHRTLLALARLRQGRAEDAVAVYQNVSVDPRILTPSALAVHAAVLKATGHDADAQSEIDKLPVDRLLPEEAALLPK